MKEYIVKNKKFYRFKHSIYFDEQPKIKLLRESNYDDPNLGYKYYFMFVKMLHSFYSDGLPHQHLSNESLKDLPSDYLKLIEKYNYLNFDVLLTFLDFETKEDLIKFLDRLIELELLVVIKSKLVFTPDIDNFFGNKNKPLLGVKKS